MNGVKVAGLGLFCVAVAVGCGGSADDAVARDIIAVYDEQTALYQQAVESRSIDDAKKLIEEAKASSEKMTQRLKEIDKKTEGWTKERKDALAARQDIKDAIVRNGKAQIDAGRKAASSFFPKVPF